jgi:hypothetical protein
MCIGGNLDMQQQSIGRALLIELIGQTHAPTLVGP